MARLCPSLPSRATLNTGDYAERELLATLERGLSDAYTLFHSVDWSRGTGAQERHGEIDIVVLNQAGDMLLIEVKAGEAEFTAAGIFKSYQGHSKNVTAQISLQYNALRSRLSDAGLTGVQVNHLLVLPDVQVQSQTVQWPRERIVDSQDLAQVVSRVTQLLGSGRSMAWQHARVLAFLENRFSVALDVSALAGRVQQSATRLSAGLATWVPRISSTSGLLRVLGTAGSGKTQLALRLLRDADAAGLKASYICFNRALADHMAQVAPKGVCTETFHELALRLVRQSGAVVDLQQAGAFDRLTTQCLALLKESAPDLDLLVLDETQDMQPEWVEALLSRLFASGRALLLEDPDQQLYKDRQTFELPDAVTIRSQENFRTPRALVALINLLRLTASEVEALSPFEGSVSDPIAYASPERIAACTIIGVERCLQKGFALEDIAIVSMRGRERSVLQGLDRLGPWPLKRFSGHFDADSNAIWTPGQLLIDSVRRFKGQAAPAVVLTECDLTQLDDLNRRLLFVGLTRARLHLEWVLSAATVHLLEQTLQA